MYFNILDDAIRKKILDRHASTNKQSSLAMTRRGKPDFGGTDIVVDQLFDDEDILSVLVENVMTQQESPDI